MMRSEFSIWMEKKYLEWQVKNGRASISEFADYLDLSQSYVSQIMNNTRKTIGLKTAVKIANRLGDESIYEILGYEMPETQDDLIKSLPPKFKSELSHALREILETFKQREINSSSEEAESIAFELIKNLSKSNSN